MKKTALISLAAIVPGFALAGTDHFVYTLLNQASGNAVQVYSQTSAGKLKLVGQTPTGGLGTGAGLGSQGALTLSQSGRYLFAVNAGDNTVSLFSINSGALTLLDVEKTGGTSPVSVTESGGLVYVLNQGTKTVAGNIQGFANFLGELITIPRAVASVSGTGVIPVEVKFTPNGAGVLVAEKVSNKIDTFKLDDRGLPTEFQYQASNGATPFGFDFDSRGRLYITEAVGGMSDASTISSYSLDADLNLKTISKSIATNQTAACWDAVSPNGRFVFTGNAGSGTVSALDISALGKLSLVKASGISGTTGGHTQDMAVSNDNEFLYVLSGTNNQITTFRINGNGGLTLVDIQANLPVGTTGLVVK